METRRTSWLLILLALSALSVSGARGQEEMKLRAEARLEKNLARVFEPVRLDIFISNAGNEGVRMHFSGAHVMFTVSLVGPSGEAVPRTAYGKMRADLDSEGANSGGTLAAGESYAAEMRDFVRSFDLTKSGKYKLVVSFSVPDKSKERGFARVTSEEVLLEVVEDNDPRLLKK